MTDDGGRKTTLSVQDSVTYRPARDRTRPPAAKHGSILDLPNVPLVGPAQRSLNRRAPGNEPQDTLGTEAKRVPRALLPTARWLTAFPVSAIMFGDADRQLLDARSNHRRRVTRDAERRHQWSSPAVSGARHPTTPSQIAIEIVPRVFPNSTTDADSMAVCRVLARACMPHSPRTPDSVERSSTYLRPTQAELAKWDISKTAGLIARKKVGSRQREVGS